MVSKQELIKKDEAHWFHPLGTAAESPHFIFTKGEGVYLWDIDYGPILRRCPLVQSGPQSPEADRGCYQADE